MLNQKTIQEHASLICSFLDEQANIHIILIDTENRIIDSNDSFRKLVGVQNPLSGHDLNQYLRDPWVQNEGVDPNPFRILMSSHLGISYALTGTAYPVPGGTLLLARRAISADETIIEKITVLSNELSNMTRELSKKNAALEKANAQISNLLRTDALTGIANRRYAYEILQRLYAYAVRHQQPLALVMADLDHFKKVNDTYGHGVGDLVLAKFARLLAENCREEDLAARFGGEEFVIILTHAEAQEAMLFAQRLCDKVPLMEIPEVEWPITASFGVAALGVNETLEGLIRAADEAMYRAKRNGRNRVEL